MLTPNNIIVQFKHLKTKRDNQLTVSEFLRDSGAIVSSECQLDLIRADVLLRLQHGEVPSLVDFVRDFAHFEPKLPEIFQAQYQEFLVGFNPLGDRGPLPINFEDYQITKTITRDWWGSVYRGIQQSVDRHVNIRIMLLPNEAAIQRATALASLSHPVINKILDVKLMDRLPLICRQHVFGDRLSSVLSENPNFFSITEAVSLTRCLAEALCEAHQALVYHLDLTADNVVIADFGMPIIVDFKMVEPRLEISPGANPTSELSQRDLIRIDIAALGSILLQIIEPSATIQAAGDSSWPPRITPTQKLGRRVPESLAPIICRTRGQSARPRFSLMRDFADELLKWESTEGLKRRHNPKDRRIKLGSGGSRGVFSNLKQRLIHALSKNQN